MSASASRTPRLPYGFARTQGVLIPFGASGSDAAIPEEAAEISLLVRDDATVSAVAEVRRLVGRPVVVRPVTRAAFDAELAEIYGQGDGSAAEVVADAGQDLDLRDLMQDLPAIEDLLEAQDDAPVIRMVNALLMQAVRERASDIHIEPFAQRSVVRLRRDGLLADIAEPPRGVHEAMVSRIKIMAQLDIAERRLPQDGRIGLKLGERSIDVRVSTVPTAHGERIVLRILEKDASRLRLSALGMTQEMQLEFAGLLARPHGLLLVCGPTGSGKTTTLYAALAGLDVKRLNIVTVEDPVEYDLPGIGQIPVNARIDLTFARALRSILRQDPDVVMIGEIRDLETAQIAIQASLTGHLVLATLHTNDAVAAVTRLVDMGVERYLLASSLIGALSQRLVRCLCPVCRQAQPITDAERALLAGGGGAAAIHDAALPDRLWTAPGCPACRGLGYQERKGIYELMPASDALKQGIHEGAGEQALRRIARSAGMGSLRSDALRYLAAGETSLDEVLRVTHD